jgi:flagellar assembly protein FliH
MISPSDNDADANPVVARLWNEPWSKDSVRPIEYKAIDHPLRRKTDRTDGTEEDVNLQEDRLRVDIARLETRLRTQALQIEQKIDESRQEAKREARTDWETELNERITEERRQIARVCTEFAASREGYFVSVEAEVVRLALAIAARVLHREAKLDPMLLTAVVRVALEKVAEDSGVTLRVPVAETEAWREALTKEGQDAVVTVVGDIHMGPTECVLETAVGHVELGVVAQLEEIEKGFFDLLQHRPI